MQVFFHAFILNVLFSTQTFYGCASVARPICPIRRYVKKRDCAANALSARCPHQPFCIAYQKELFFVVTVVAVFFKDLAMAVRAKMLFFHIKGVLVKEDHCTAVRALVLDQAVAVLIVVLVFLIIFFVFLVVIVLFRRTAPPPNR